MDANKALALAQKMSTMDIYERAMLILEIRMEGYKEALKDIQQ